MAEKDPFANHPSDSPGYQAPDLRSSREPQTHAAYVHCPGCGYNLTGATIGSQCPECDLTIGPAAFAGQGLPTSGKATASLILGIFSIVGCCTYGIGSLICGPLALYFSRQAKRDMDGGLVDRGGESLATVGFVCGIIGTVFGVLGVLAMVVSIVADVM